MLGYPDKDTNDEDFVPKKQNTKSKSSWIFVSKNHLNKKNLLSSNISNLVMSTNVELQHQDYLHQRISSAYIFFGIVRSYSTVDNPNEKEKININIDWSVAETGHTQIKSENKNILHMHPIKNYAVNVLPVSGKKRGHYRKMQQPTSNMYQQVVEHGSS